MAFNETLRLIVSADTRGAVAGLKAVGTAADQELGGKAAGGLDRFGAGLTRAGIGMATTGALMVGGLYKAAQASEQANLQLVKLENSMANNPKLAGMSSKAFTDLAASIQRKTAADDDSIIGGQAVLAQMGLEADQIAALTPLVVDLARKKGIDMVQAATLAAKAVDGNSGALKRSGIAVDEAAFKTDSYAATVDALRDSVGGFAEAEGETFSGKIERLKNQMGDLAEGVGGGAVDAFSSMFDAITPVVDGFNSLDPAVQGTVGKFAAFGGAGLIFAGVASTIIGQIITMRERFGQAATALQGMRGKMAGVGSTAAVAATQVGLLYTATQLLGRSASHADIPKLQRDILAFADSGRMGGEAASAFGTDLDKLGQAVERVAAPSNASKVQNFSSAWQRALGDTDDHLSTARARIDDLDKALAGLAGQDPAAAAASLTAITAAMDPATAGRLLTLLDDYDSAVAGAGVSSELAGGQVDEFGNAVDEAGDPTADLAAELEDAKRAMDDLYTSTNDAIGSTFAYKDKVREAAEKQAELNELVKDGKTGTEEYYVAVDDAAQSLWEQSEAAASNAAKQYEVAGASLKASEVTGVQIGELKRLQETTEPGSDLWNALAGMIGQLESMKSKQVTIEINEVWTVSGATSRFNQGRESSVGAASGGEVPVYAAAGMSIGFGPRGTDTVPAWLTPGEFVMKKSAVDRLGVGTMEQINQGRVPVMAGGGAQTIVVQVGDEVLARVVANAVAGGARRGIG